MAIFSNQATLTYNGNRTNSNIAYGEILDVLSATKTAVNRSYTPGQTITYAVTLRNTGTTPLTGLTIADDLGQYTLGETTVNPLTYEANSAKLFINGAPQPDPEVTADPTLRFTGLNVPAGGDLVLVYQARANAYADPNTDGTIVNTITVTGNGIGTPVTATATVPAAAVPQLTINKSISPAQVVDNERVTYTFVIQNTGNTPVTTADNAAITDDFDPILTDLSVTFNGAPWNNGMQYGYNETTGLFTTVPGQITVPAATYTQDPATGAYTVSPGIATLIVTGTI